MRAWMLGVLIVGSLTASVRAAEVSVAVASNFTAPMQKIAAAFEQDTNWHREAIVRGRIVLLRLHRQGATYVLVGQS